MRDEVDRSERPTPRRHDIAGLAQSVVKILAERGETLETSNRDARIAELLDAARHHDADALDLFLDQYDAAGLPRVRLFDTILPGVAVRMGEMWLDDTMGFDAVSLATTRLQRLLTRITPPPEAADPSGDAPAVLLVVQASDAHRLAPQLLAAHLRRHDLAVRLLAASRTEEVARLVEGGGFDAVFFSCSGPGPLADMREMLQTLRRTTTLPPTALGGCVTVSHRNASNEAGVDLVTNDLSQAIALVMSSRDRAAKAGP